MNRTLLKIEGLSKSFGENSVLKDINLEIRPGEIVGLVGENGAGKSTLMKIIFGMPVIAETGGYKGKMYFEGKEAAFKTSLDALNAGIGMVHQEFSLIPGFTAGENIVLNRESTKGSLLENLFGSRIEKLDIRSIQERAEKSISHLGVNIDPATMVQEMPVAHMQFTEIAREIERENTKLLVLDEPTAVLTEKEAEILLDTMRRLAKDGIAIIFITHRLNEIMNVCDKVVVLRDGVLINEVETQKTDVDQITEWMIGRKMESSSSTFSYEEKGEIILDIKNLWVDMPGERVRDVNLQIKRGEILGVGGMAGQGKVGIANGIMGLYDAGGEVRFKDEKIDLLDTKGTLKKGLFFVSEDRKGVGLILDKSIEENISYPAQQIKGEFFKKKLLGMVKSSDGDAVRENARRYIEKLNIRCMGEKQNTQELSGGNQQKVCLAKAFTMNPELLFVSEPTRGIDVGAKRLVLETLRECNKELGTTIVITSSELEELREICHRIAIVNEGAIAGILPPDAPLVDFGKMMVGIKIGGSHGE